MVEKEVLKIPSDLLMRHYVRTNHIVAESYVINQRALGKFADDGQFHELWE